MYVILQNPDFRLLYLRYSHIWSSDFVVTAKTLHKQCMIFINLRFLEFRFSPHLRHENSIPTPFGRLHVGFKFILWSLGCTNNTVIVCSGRYYCLWSVTHTAVYCRFSRACVWLVKKLVKEAIYVKKVSNCWLWVMDVWAALKFVIIHYAERRKESWSVLCGETLILFCFTSFFTSRKINVEV